MNLKEREDVIRTATIIRTARKLRGKTQSDIASLLGVSQSFLSKLENGRLIPSSSQWFLFCKTTQINPMKTFDTGFIDHGLSVASTNPYPESIFKLHPRYLENQASKVRASLPFIQYFKETLGQAKFDQFCESREVDPDFFWVLDNPININFCLDIMSQLISDGGLRSENLAGLMSHVKDPSMHGLLREDYDPIQDPVELLERLILNKEKYEINFKYTIEQKQKNGLTLSISPNPILQDFNYKRDDLGDFICRYKKDYFKSFASYGGKFSNTSLVETQCHFHGHEKCVYEIQVAA